MSDVALDAFRDQFARSSQPGKSPSGLERLRREAFAHFQARGFPGSREEEWRYTRLDGLASTPFQAPPAAAEVGHDALEARFLFETSTTRLVFVDGRFVPGLSSQPSQPRGVRIQTLQAAFAAPDARLKEHFGLRHGLSRRPFLALNTAFFRDGALLRLEDGSLLNHPVHLMFVSSAASGPTAAHPRVVVHAGRGSHATIVETHVGLDGGTYLNNAVTEIHAEADSVVQHYKVQEDGPDAFHIGQLDLQLAGGARVTSHTLSFGAALARHEIQAGFSGPGAEVELNGLYVVSGRQHVDVQTRVEHGVPGCTSRQSFRGVLDDHARGVFGGRVLVKPDAQQTVAQQANKNLLLSDTAVADSKPQLEIHADDVKCAHGVAIGQLDPDAVFYLRSRGVGAVDANRILTRAFAGAVTERIPIATLRCRIDLMLSGRLAGVSEAAAEDLLLMEAV